MNGNSSKQVLLSIIGIAVLVIAVVGVSFAFFTYSKAGSSNNTLTTGSIVFNFTDGDAIYLTNQFPVNDATGSAIVATGEENAVLNFSVVGYDTSAKGISYTVVAIEGNTNGTKVRLKDSEIKLKMTASSSNSSAITNNYENAAVVGTAGSLASGVDLATGKITATTSGAQQTDSYTLRMWITSNVVSIDDQSTSGGSDSVYTSEEFANLYYSLRVRVDARTAS